MGCRLPAEVIMNNDEPPIRCEPIKTEPTADMRRMAATYWQVYVAFIDEGFKPEQAMYLLGEMVSQ